MEIELLKIENLRNIRNAELKPSSRINLITGRNGAGKTTLLESIYLAARARSFRQSQNNHIISKESELLNIFIQTRNSDGNIQKIGLQKAGKTTRVRKDGVNLSRLSDLAISLPLCVITSNIQKIIEDEPLHRRKLLNWGMFHVEHEYALLTSKYKKALIQRNHALRNSNTQLKVWDQQVATLGSEISIKMEKYIYEWNKSLNNLFNDFPMLIPIKIQYRQGWRNGISLYEAIQINKNVDIERGFTSSGPHRADLRITDETDLVKNRYSRGQLKICTILIMLAQVSIQIEKNRESPILLVDDLHSELDKNSYKDLIACISKFELQSFITALDPKIEENITDGCQSRLFHVEHGSVCIS